MTLSYLLNRQNELIPLMIESSNFGLLRAKKDPLAEAVESTYYKLQSEFNSNRILINDILDSQRKIKTNIKPIVEKEQREITSTTYIKAQNLLNRNHDIYFGRGMNK